MLTCLFYLMHHITIVISIYRICTLSHQEYSLIPKKKKIKP